MSSVLPAATKPPVHLPEERPVASRQAPALRRSLRKLVVPMLLAVAFGAGWVVSARNSQQHEKEALPAAAPTADSSLVSVTVEPVARRPVQRVVEAVGTLHGFEEVAISARVEGRVSRLLHDVGDSVKPGELLLQIDPTDYELAVQQAESSLKVELAKLGVEAPPSSTLDLTKLPVVMLAQARLDNAQSRFDRARQLTTTRAMSAAELDGASSDLRAAQAELANQLLLARSALATMHMENADLAIARQQLADTRVTAPTPTLAVPGGDEVSYVISQRTVPEGALVRPGTEIFKLVINRTLKMRAPVPDRHALDVRAGQAAQVTTAATRAPFAGKVSRVNPVVEAATRTFEVEIQIPNDDGRLKPGSFAKAGILVRNDDEADTVPLSAVVHFAGISKIFVVENGRSKEVRVTLGVQTPEWVEIVEPALPHDAVVVTSGQTMLADDTRVSVRNATAK